MKIIKQIYWQRISQSEIRNSAAEKSKSESEGGPRRRNFVSLRGKQKFLLFACPVASRRFCYGARPSVQFLPHEARQSIGVLLEKGSSFVQQLRPQLNFQEFCRLIQPRFARQRTETLARRAERGSPSAGSKSLAILSICFAQLKTNSINL